MKVFHLLLVAPVLVSVACGDGLGDDATVDGAPDAAADGASDGGPSDGGSPDGGSDVGLPDAPDAGSVTIDESVDTVEGPVEGDADGDLVVFRGIPYAEPPVGARRLRPAEAHSGWTDPLDATVFGPACPQPDGGSTTGQEDCLSLNIWAPREGGPRPVMVFIHGGAFAIGQAGTPISEGSALARAGDVIVVTIQYRLGALGWLTTEALAAESADGSIGNYGLTDQVAALAWVQRNIAAFGGDPSAVTVFGESAGGISVCALLGTARADGLFGAAIIESGGGCHDFEAPRTSYFGRPSMMDRGEVLATAAGCDAAAATSQVDCLRALSVDEVLSVQGPAIEAIGRTLLGSVQFAPNLDDVILTEDPLDRIARGGVPILIGSNADEARLFTATTAVLTWRNFENRVRALLGADADAVIALYPRTDFARPKQAFDVLLTDLAFACSTLSLAEARAGSAGSTHVYNFTRVMDGVFGALGATHAVELFFVFGNFPARYTSAPEDVVVMTDMQSAWTTFARTGAPAPSASWPAYDPAAPQIGVFDAPFVTAAEIRADRCSGLAAIGLVP